MRNIDFSSGQTLLLSLLGLALVTLIGVGLRLVAMQTIQQRRERENRQINERLRTLISAYKTLGGSFTGNLAVDPTHLRDLKRRGESVDSEEPAPAGEPRAAAIHAIDPSSIVGLIVMSTFFLPSAPVVVFGISILGWPSCACVACPHWTRPLIARRSYGAVM